MRALKVVGRAKDAAAGIAALTVEKTPAPDAPGEGEVLIDVVAGALNFADLLMLTGAYQATPEVPFTAGMELSGTVRAVGRKVDGVFVGDRVAAFAGSGAFAERALVRDAACLQLPPQIALADGAALPIAFGTAHVGLTRRARLRAGELLLVTGAGGGVGLAAVAVGKALGATVIAAAGGPDKLARAKAHGADHIVDYRTEDLREAVKTIAAERGKAGADVAFDPVGGAAFEAAQRALAFEGRLLVIGFAAGDVPQIAANRLLVKNIDALGFYWGAYAQAAPQVHRDSFHALYEMFEQHRLQPEIGARFPLDRAADAYRALAERGVAGKVLIEIAGGT
ncbi:MAG: NADPH:quinone oxidoreductase family protein [Marivibrio sp.]|uniref:NADPH:quinone oxidoreductase family protein n=1 Tax=Marivibrio sp. TaxID=2039719 RepID=UPI0032ED75DF